LTQSHSLSLPYYYFIFFFHNTATPNIYTLSLHDALPIYTSSSSYNWMNNVSPLYLKFDCSIKYIICSSFSISRIIIFCCFFFVRSEEHMSELQSRFDLVCRLLLEKKI